MKQTYRAPELVTLHLVYSGVMVIFVAPNAYGVNELQHFGLLVLATAVFLVVWGYLTKEHRLPPWLAFLGGLWVGGAIGIVELALFASTWPKASSASTGLSIAAIEFGVTFALLSGWFLMLRNRIGQWLALGSGMWLGAVAWIVLFIVLMASYGVRGSLSG
jgi:hypothetical protein